MEKRTCLDCVHWSFSGGSPGYSSWTPGYDSTIDCDKGHWRLVNLEGANTYNFREAVAKASGCPDFTDISAPVPPSGDARRVTNAKTENGAPE